VSLLGAARRQKCSFRLSTLHGLSAAPLSAKAGPVEVPCERPKVRGREEQGLHALLRRDGLPTPDKR